MKRTVLVGMVMAVVVLVLGGGQALAGQPPLATTVNGHYLVVFKASTLPPDAARVVADSGGTMIRTFDQIGVLSAAGNETFVKRIARNKQVLTVGPEHMYTLPPREVFELGDDAMVTEAGPVPAEDVYYDYQWDIRRIGAPAVWDRFPLTEVTPRVAVLDVGVMDDHPDLVGQVDNSETTAYCPTDAGYPVYTTFIDFDAYPDWEPDVDPCTALGFVDYETHGTHVAGTIAAKFGGGKVVGVAPDAKIGAYKVFDVYQYQGDLYLAAFDGPIFAAIIEATEAGYPVISMSLGGYVARNNKADNASYLAWDRVAKWANRMGVLIVASAGNGAADLNGPLTHIPSDLPTVMSTSATAAGHLTFVPSEGGDVVDPGTDYLASYSNFGAAVDIAAPGGDCTPPDVPCTDDNIPLYLNYWILNDGIYSDGTPVYYFMIGTSMATPHVSAVAAWVRALHPDWTPGAVRAWLKDTAEQIGSRQDFGHGMVDADAATQ